MGRIESMTFLGLDGRKRLLVEPLQQRLASFAQCALSDETGRI
jgi:hypothetical protein